MRLVALAALAASLALVAAACGGSGVQVQNASAAGAKAAVGCRHAAGWQKLADRIAAPVFCPNWLPDPLTGKIGDRWNNIDVVSKDRSYLESWVWQDTDGPNTTGELHVNLRGYPGRAKVPTCQDTLVDAAGHSKHVTLPCFADPQGLRTINGIRFQTYTVNQGADQWHLLYAWHYKGGLYTISEHVAPPLTFDHVKRYLDRMVRNLVVVAPQG